MLIIRLSRHGRTKKPFYRVVLTEHTKPAKSGYKSVLGFYDPLNHKLDVKVDEIKDYISQGSQVSSRLAKMLFNQTKDDVFSKFFIINTKNRTTKKEEKKS
ncbi:MAG: 30S ribosomal protein S16 [Candidatus Absconditicoccaceae bacterium]